MGKFIAGIIGLIFLAVALGYGGFVVKRWFNWEFAYKDNVIAASTETVCKMVKPEYLKDPNQCK